MAEKLNNQQHYNRIFEKIKAKSQHNSITYNGGVGGDEYSAEVYDSDDILIAMKKEYSASTLCELHKIIDREVK